MSEFYDKKPDEYVMWFLLLAMDSLFHFTTLGGEQTAGGSLVRFLHAKSAAAADGSALKLNIRYLSSCFMVTLDVQHMSEHTTVCKRPCLQMRRLIAHTCHVK
jgi:hypothetical protein